MRPPDTECRDDQFAAARRCPLDDFAQAFRGFLDGLVKMASIGALADEQLAGRDRSGFVQDRQTRPAKVAGERQALFAAICINPEIDHRRTKQMSRVDERGLQATSNAQRRIVRDRLQAQKRAVHVAAVIKRFDFRFAFLAFMVQICGIFNLNLGGVAEHDVRQSARGRCAINRADEALLDEIRQIAAMVDMGMAQQDGVDLFWPERKLAVAAMAFASASLEEPAIEQQGLSARIDPVHRAGHGPGCAPKCYRGFQRWLARFGHEKIDSKTQERLASWGKARID